MKQYSIPNDMLPTKKLFSSMSLAHLEKRRNALEHYLQRLINRFGGHRLESLQIIQHMSKFKSDTVHYVFLGIGSSVAAVPTLYLMIFSQLHVPILKYDICMIFTPD